VPNSASTRNAAARRGLITKPNQSMPLGCLLRKAAAVLGQNRPAGMERSLRITVAGAMAVGCLGAMAGCAPSDVAIEYRAGYAFSRTERSAIQTVADRAARDVRQLLPALPTGLRITVQTGDRVIPETGENGSIGLPAAVYWTVDPNHAGGVVAVVNAQLRATLFHEWYHLVREAKFAPQTLVERAVNEGLATAFERDFGGAPTPWGAYPAENGVWTKEFLALAPGADFREWMYEHPDGRRWIGFKVGTYLADRAARESRLSLAELAGQPTERILALARVR
jgi:hypothetical protein